jgi:hypothetical protein
MPRPPSEYDHWSTYGNSFGWRRAARRAARRRVCSEVRLRPRNCVPFPESQRTAGTAHSARRSQRIPVFRTRTHSAANRRRSVASGGPSVTTAMKVRCFSAMVPWKSRPAGPTFHAIAKQKLIVEQLALEQQFTAETIAQIQAQMLWFSQSASAVAPNLPGWS